VDNLYTPNIGVDEFYGLQGLIQAARIFRGRIPAGLLPVAQASGGNLICLRVGSKSSSDDVVFWDHEKEGTPGAVEPLGIRFNQFMKSLHRMSPSEHAGQVLSVTINKPDVFREILRRQEEARSAPTVTWPPETS
jgi:hypothetical protein